MAARGGGASTGDGGGFRGRGRGRTRGSGGDGGEGRGGGGGRGRRAMAPPSYSDRKSFIRGQGTSRELSGNSASAQPPRVLSSSLVKKQKEYYDRFATLLTYELEEDMAQMHERLRKWGTQRLQREGITLFSLVAKHKGSLFNERIVRLTPQRATELPYHRFSQGDMVVLSRDDPLSERTVDGTVLEKKATYINIVVRDLPRELTFGTWRMDKGANRVTHDRMMEALAIFTSNEVIPENSVSTNSGESCSGGSSSSSSQSKSGSSSTSSASSSSNSRAASSSSASSSKKEVMMGGTLLRNIILGNVWGNDYKAAAAKPPEGLSEYYKKSNFPPDFDTWRLNDSQRQVIRSVLTRRLTLIQGPPGTGKTFTAIHLMRLLVHLCKSRVPVLCTADTNVAVDNLLQGLSDFGIRALRVGRPVKVREELRGLSLDAQILAHPRTAELTKLRDRTVELSNQIPELKDSAKNIAHMDLQSTWAKLKELESRIAKEILDGAQVICATCIGAGHELLRNRQFPIVILDESTQATEPASLCPLVHGSKHVVLMGDHFQLPPTVISPKGQEGGLGESLFSRLIKLGITTHMLEIQYRMHPMLSQFPSRHFYEGRLQDGVTAQDREAPSAFPWPDPSIPVAFVHVSDGKEETTTSGMSKYNEKEASVVVDIVDMFRRYYSSTAKRRGNGSKEREEEEVEENTKSVVGRDWEQEFFDKPVMSKIGIVTAYNGQVKMLTDKFTSRGGLRRGDVYHKLNISSVDGFQGREKEVIIFSAVRANNKGKVGFLKDWRRLNVAITRSRRGLIVVGHEQTLLHDLHWKEWLEWVHAHQLVLHPEDLLLPLSVNTRPKATSSASPPPSSPPSSSASNSAFTTSAHSSISSDSHSDTVSDAQPALTWQVVMKRKHEPSHVILQQKTTTLADDHPNEHKSVVLDEGRTEPEKKRQRVMQMISDDNFERHENPNQLQSETEADQQRDDYPEDDAQRSPPGSPPALVPAPMLVSDASAALSTKGKERKQDEVEGEIYEEENEEPKAELEPEKQKQKNDEEEIEIEKDESDEENDEESEAEKVEQENDEDKQKQEDGNGEAEEEEMKQEENKQQRDEEPEPEKKELGFLGVNATEDKTEEKDDSVVDTTSVNASEAVDSIYETNDEDDAEDNLEDSSFLVSQDSIVMEEEEDSSLLVSQESSLMEDRPPVAATAMQPILCIDLTEEDDEEEEAEKHSDEVRLDEEHQR